MRKNDFVIPVNGLAPGETTFLLEADKEFFAKFENGEVLAADLHVTIVADKRRERIDFDCEILGSVTVPCDRCLAPVEMPVDTSVQLRLNFGGTVADDDDTDSFEEVFMQDGADSIDLSQEIYDFSLLALPLQRFHKDGECEKAALDCLSLDEAPATDSLPVDTPFSNLADMLKNEIVKNK